MLFAADGAAVVLGGRGSILFALRDEESVDQPAEPVERRERLFFYDIGQQRHGASPLVDLKVKEDRCLILSFREEVELTIRLN